MDVNERRHSERHLASHNQVRLLWDENQDVFETKARLIDTSSDGARFVAEVPLPLGREVYFRLEIPRKSGWLSARVVRLDGLTEGGLSFSGRCPHHLIVGLT